MDKQYFIPYKTGEEMLALKADLVAAKKRILAAYPNLAQDYADRIAYSKYSKEDNLRALIPSAVVDYGRVPKLIDKLPKNKNTDIYREYAYDASGNMLITNYVLKENFSDEIFYIVDFEGYRYLINYPNEITAKDIIFRLKFENDKLVLWEEYSSRGLYYSEVYYTLDNKLYCTTELMHCQHESTARMLQALEEESLLTQKKHENDAEWLKEIAKESFTRVVESIERDKREFEENVKLSATDKRSIINLNFYELTYDSSGALEQLDEINLARNTKKTVYPKKSKNCSNLLKTRQSAKRLKDRLSAKGYSATKGICFSDFWVAFKEFALSDKFDCADDSILWEPLNTSIHIARQFVRENANGDYQGMEQLNIDIDVPFTKFSEPFAGTFWSGDDLEEFFKKVEQTDEFKSIDYNTEIVLSLIFDKV